MSRFGGQILKATTSTTIGVASLEAAASSPKRVALSELWLGSDAGTLGTSSFRFDITRSTTASAGTTVTPAPLDPADLNITAIIRSSLSAEGTTAGVIPLSIAISQQATARWVANPGSEIIIPGTASNGLIIKTPVAGNTPSFAGSLIATEL